MSDGKNKDCDLNFEYCFFSNIGCGNFEIGSLTTVKIDPPNNIFKLNGKDYKDPDNCSEELYRYHKAIWNNTFPNGVKMSSIEYYCNKMEYKILAKVNDKKFYLGSDYIGFSLNWIPKNIETSIIEDSLRITRTFCGHIIFPKGFYKGWFYCKKDKKIHYSEKNIYTWYEMQYGQDSKMYKNLYIYTVNLAKGGKGGFYDRFDWTLKMIKTYFECINECKEIRLIRYLNIINAILEKEISINKETIDAKEILTMQSRFINLYFGLDNSREWFLLFNDFHGFVDYFCLRNSFVDEKDTIINLADWLPILPNDYKGYMETTVNQIKKRNIELEKRIKEDF